MDSCNAFALGTCHGVGFRETWRQDDRHRGKLSILATGVWKCLREEELLKRLFPLLSQHSESTPRTLWAVSSTLRLPRRSMLASGCCWNRKSIGSMDGFGLRLLFYVHDSWPALLHKGSTLYKLKPVKASDASSW